jgi:hypothetical protein
MNADPDISEPTNLSVLENLVDVPVLAVEHNQHEFEDITRRLW